MRNKSTKRHSVIILPGLSDKVRNIEIATCWWKYQGLMPHVFRVGWRDDTTKFRSKLDKIIKLVDDLSREGFVSIVGTSAGGSAAFNAFLERPHRIQRAISICGRLRAGRHNRRSFKKMSATSESFKHSVLLFEESEHNIPSKFRSRMMTVTARFGDELVPADTSFLQGAYNIKVPTGEHIFSIGMSLTLLARPVINFIKFGKTRLL